ncbi:MAG TPA: TIGR02757 family protein [Campylobacterales bacterium]|nr:TIGR02757 family protein [Campylobacterales bacterium]HIP59010.1 TIGR02757 family protein [Campylobacterales bacterium]
MTLKYLLDKEVLKRNSIEEINNEKPDPMLVACIHRDEVISLICALFAYGNAKQIVKFLSSLDFDLLNAEDEKIKKTLSSHYYRFQKSNDVAEFFITLKRLKNETSLEESFLLGYRKENLILEGLESVISKLWSLNSYDSRGYKFLLGVPPHKKSTSTYKRWNMYLRWMVREDNIDMGLWSEVDKSNLLIPLDTHTFKVSLSLGLMERKTYDLKAVIELTNKLKTFDPHDPIKYDFALYRLGQEKDLAKFKRF